MKNLRGGHFIMALLITFTSLMGPSLTVMASTDKGNDVEHTVDECIGVRK